MEFGRRLSQPEHVIEENEQFNGDHLAAGLDLFREIEQDRQT